MSDAMHALLTATRRLDLDHPDIEALAARRGWRTLSPYDRIGSVLGRAAWSADRIGAV